MRKKLTRKIRPEQMQVLQNFKRDLPFSGELPEIRNGGGLFWGSGGGVPTARKFCKNNLILELF